MRLPVLLMGALLTACATPTPVVIAPVEGDPAVSEAELWEQHHRAVTTLVDWEAKGKVAFNVPDESGSASLNWRQRDTQSRLRLAGPLGANAVVLRSEGAGISLTRDGIERLYPADAAPWLGDGRLLPVPVASIQHWLRGIPDPDKPLDLLRTRDGIAQQIEQDGWSISYESYETQNGLQLPERLTVVAPRVSLRLRLLVRRWEY